MQILILDLNLFVRCHFFKTAESDIKTSLQKMFGAHK